MRARDAQCVSSTICTFSSVDQRRRRYTDVITSTCSGGAGGKNSP